MIAQFKKTSGWPVAAVALIALIGCVSLTDAKKENAVASNNAGALNQASGPGGRPVIQKVAGGFNHIGARPSPDGRYFVVIDWGRNPNVVIHDARTGEKRNVTSDARYGTGQGYWPLWSPDGKQVACYWSLFDRKDSEGKVVRRGGIRIIDRDGGPPREIDQVDPGKFVQPRDWTPDGRHIVGLEVPRERPEAGPTNRIVLVDVVTGEIKGVKQLPGATQPWQVTLAISPDGRHIAYDFPGSVHYEPTVPPPVAMVPSQIRVVNTDGSNDRVLVDHPANDWNPCWTADGRHLVFLSDRTGADALWLVPVRQGERAGEPTLLRHRSDDLFPIGCAKDGTLFCTTSKPDYNVFVADVDFAAGTVQSPQQVSRRFEGRNRVPLWSRDGSKLAYVSPRGGRSPVLVLHDVASGQDRDVEVPSVADEAYVESCWGQWSPDGTKLVFRGRKDRNSGALYTLDVPTGKVTVTVAGERAWPALAGFTPDGKRLVYLNGLWSNPAQLIERELVSGQERVIHSSTNGFKQVLLSPDGSRIASQHGGLAITERESGATQIIWEYPKGNWPQLAWLPDSRRLLVALLSNDKNESQQLYVVDTTTGSRRPIGSPTDDRFHALSGHPDGKRIAFSRGGETHEIWAMKNFVPAENLAAK